MIHPAVLAVFLAAGIAALVKGAQGRARAHAARARLFDAPETPVVAQDAEPTSLDRWLALAGYRAPGTAATFLGATAVAVVVGAALALTLEKSGLGAVADQGLRGVPGGLGDVLRPVVRGAPWIALVIFGSAPILVVRAARRRRVADVEKDLPLSLEMLAALSEAGLGFDAALARILDGQSALRPLAQELRVYQAELLAGTARVRCLRNLARRLEVPSVGIFVSALVQAEQVGAGLTEVLRRQADDLRNRHRERILIQAEALPVKLVFPLVICYLPGIFVLTLGPSFLTFFEIADSIIRSTAR